MKFLNKLFCCFSVGCGGFIVGIIDLIVYSIMTVWSGVKVEAAYEYNAEDVGSFYQTARVILVFYYLLGMFSSLLFLLGIIKVRNKNSLNLMIMRIFLQRNHILMIFFVVLNATYIFLYFLEHVKSKFLDKIDAINNFLETGEEIKEDEEGFSVLEILMMIFMTFINIYVFLLSLGAWLSIKTINYE